MIYLILGKSCSGKTTLVNFVEEKYGISVIKQYTTRKRRNSLDNEYFFVDKDEFLKKDIIYRKKYNGNLYGVSYQSLCNINSDVILITDLRTAKKIKKKYQAQIIYVRSPLKQRIIRLKNGEVRNGFRIVIDILYEFDILFADKIINNYRGKAEFINEIQGYFDKMLKNS